MALADRMDTGFEPPAEWTHAGVEAEESHRLLGDALLALAAASVPRRLGGDATVGELSKDKKLSRKIANSYLVCLRFYGASRGDWRELLRRAGEEAGPRAAGASVIWTRWLDDRLNWLEQRAAHIARYAVLTEETVWGNKMLFRLDRERDLLKLARDTT